MEKPRIPQSEEERLNALKSYSILDTMSEEDYDAITHIASHICGTPISLISLIDEKRQWFKSHHGLAATETPRDYAFCAHAINSPNQVFEVKDARLDVRFHDNPLVTDEPHVIFYSGVPLVTDDGHALGTLCVIDNKANSLTDEQRASLKKLANQVMNLLELRKKSAALEESLHLIEATNSELRRFASVAAHDIRGPLNNISTIADLLKNDYRHDFSAKAAEWLDRISASASHLTMMVDDLLKETVATHRKTEVVDCIHPKTVIDELRTVYAVSHECEIKLNTDLKELRVNRVTFKQILHNLVSNAIKYNDKPLPIVDITIGEALQTYTVEVRDNGAGIPQARLKDLFKPFMPLSGTDRFGKQGTGMGLATVKRLLDELNGDITVSSVPGQGSSFKFSLPR
jgi:signal transduction histidine kinase